jgi:AraC family transcriptional activator of pobA
MAHTTFDPVPVVSYADDGIGPRFGIRAGRITPKDLLLHRHDYLEIWFFVASGSPQRISVREHITRRGSIFFIPPMTPHQPRFDVDDACFVLYFDLSFLRPEFRAAPLEIDSDLLARAPELAPFVYQNDIDFILSENDVSTLKSYCDCIVAERARQHICSEQIIRAQLVQLLAAVTRRFERQIRDLIRIAPPCGGAQQHVKNAIKFINANVTKRITLTDAARHVAVSPNYLAGLLKRELGKTFLELITEKRMDRACELLSFTNLHISQIAYHLAFDDPDYFCKRFKQQAACTPMDFRARHNLIVTKHDSRQERTYDLRRRA